MSNKTKNSTQNQISLRFLSGVSLILLPFIVTSFININYKIEQYYYNRNWPIDNNVLFSDNNITYILIALPLWLGVYLVLNRGVGLNSKKGVVSAGIALVAGVALTYVCLFYNFIIR
jgi:hypothetical protein